MARKVQHLGQGVGVPLPLPGGVCILESLLCRGSAIQRFCPSLQEISQGSKNLSTVRQEAAVKVYHTKKTLQLFDILRGWAVFDFGGVIGRGGQSCCRDHVSKDF